MSLELLVLEKRERISVNTANLVVVLTIKIMYHIDEEISVGRCINRNLSEVNILASRNRDSGAVETYIPDTETAFDWLNYHS